MFAALLPSDRGHFARVHSGDVKIYANQDLLPRATVVTQTLQADGPEQAAALLQEQLARRPSGPVSTVVGKDGAPCRQAAAARGRQRSSATRRNALKFTLQVMCRACSCWPTPIIQAGTRASTAAKFLSIPPTYCFARACAGRRTLSDTPHLSPPAGAWAQSPRRALVLTTALGLLAVWGFRRQREHAV